MPKVIQKTAQQIFDRVLTHLRQQGVAATVTYPETGKVTCAYRTPEGLSCAAGCLFPDSAYSSEMEGSGVRYLNYAEFTDEGAKLLLKALKAGGVEKHISLVATLQTAHDKFLDGKLGMEGNMRKWENKMLKIAVEERLHYTPKVETS